MYTKKNFIKILLGRFPDFQKSWNEHLEFWNGEPAGVCNEMSTFSQYVVDLLKIGKKDNLKEIFDLIEDFITYGDTDIQTAATTCFLENLINVTGEQISAKSYIHLLGKESIEYCKAWDEFTGVKTEGLWD